MNYIKYPDRKVGDDLFSDEISVDKPRAKYDFGPSELFDVIAHSNSTRAHQAMISLLVTRLTNGDHQGMFYEGQDEFDHKAQVVWSLLRAYKDYANNDLQRSLLGNDLRQVLEAYTGNGEVAGTVRKGRNKYQKERDERAIKAIAGDLLTVLLTSPDVELAYRASDVILQELGSEKALALETDPTALSRAKLFLICLDSLDHISDKTNLEVYGETVTVVFGNAEIGRTLSGFAEAEQRYQILRSQPNVLRALANWRRHDFAIDEKGKRAKEEAKAGYEKEMRPANEIARQLRRDKNQFLLGLVRDAVNGSELSAPAISAFDGLIKRIEFSNYDMTVIPEEYYQLMDIARLPNITSDQRNTIVWRIAEQFKYLHDNSEGLLLPVIIDIYELVLGPLDNVRIPDRNTSLGLAAATSIVRENRSIFRSATPEQLQILASYGDAIQTLARMVLGNGYLTDGNQEKALVEIDVENLGEPADPRAWNKERLYELQNVARELKAIAEYYEGYLHIQAVKVDPKIYYPWVLQKLVPFWQKMQWEVGPGNRPTRDISELYRMMERYIRSEFVIAEQYPQDFDVFEAGHIDGFLVELYNRVVTNHDINYNTTVWQEGQTFILNAVSNMPPVLLEKIINKHRGTPFAKWLQAEHERWNKEE